MKMSNILSLEQIREAKDVTETTIPVSEWGGDVVVRSVTKRQMKGSKNTAKGSDGELDDDEVEKQIFLAGMINPSITPEDYEWMQDKSASSMTKVMKAIIGVSGMGDDAVKVEEKTFPAGQ